MLDLSKYRKTVTAVVGVVLLVAVNFLPEYVPAVQSAIAALTAIGVYEIPNAS